MSVVRDLLAIRNLFVVSLVPLVLLPLVVCIEGTESSCAYVMIIMAVFWLTEALPISVTALLPVFMFPITGVMSANDVAAAFFNSTSLMFIGGMSVAVAIEEWRLHNRLALKTVLLLGVKPAWLMLALMLTSWFLSMWISNTATTAMMLPIAAALFDQVRNNDTNKNTLMLAISDADLESATRLTVVKDPDDQLSMELVINGDSQKSRDSEAEESSSNDVTNDTNDVMWNHVKTGFCLCIAYAANIGGTASLTGTVTNLVLKGLLDDLYLKNGKKSPITFGSWLAFGVPTSLIIVGLSWLWLQGYFLRGRGIFTCCRRSLDTSTKRESNDTFKAVLREQYRQLGPMSFGEYAVCGHFVMMALLWITRDLGGTYGWGSLFKDRFIQDSVPGILVMCFLFIFPASVPRVFCWKNKEGAQSPVKPLLSWHQFNAKMPWGVVFLVGGGFSMAKASQVSGLSAWIGHQLSSLDHLPPWLLLMVLCTIVALATEVTSNSATVSLILPIIAGLAFRLGLEPIYLMLPVTVAASFAFMLPVATPPNALVFAFGDFRIIDMVKAGFLLNFVGIFVLVGCMHTIGAALF